MDSSSSVKFCVIESVDSETLVFVSISGSSKSFDSAVLFESAKSSSPVCPLGLNVEGGNFGKGTIFKPDGEMYEGVWKDGKMYGSGTYSIVNGDKYIGEIKDEKYHGLGKYIFKDGRIYEGEWKDGNYHGSGKFTFQDGRIYEGEWEDGEKNGNGTMTYSDGNTYKGEFKDVDGWVWMDGCEIGRASCRERV